MPSVDRDPADLEEKNEETPDLERTDNQARAEEESMGMTPPVRQCQPDEAAK